MHGLYTLAIRFVVRDLMRNWIRTGLTVVGIALGVAVMLAINLANGTALSRFRESIDLVAGKSNLEIHALAGSEVNQNLLRNLQWLWGEDVKFTAVIDESAVVPGLHPEIVQVLGVDMFADPAFRPFNVAGANGVTDFGIFKANAAYIGSKFAERQSLKVGDSFKALMNDRAAELKVAGIISYSGPGKAFGGNLVVMDIGPAQQAFNMAPHISRVDMIVPESRVAEVQRRLQEMLPRSIAVSRPQRRGEQVQKMIASFQYNLGALSLIALLVGMFLIYNTMSMTVIRKRSEIGILRALGASRSLIFALFTMQALFIGAIGSLLGLLAGYWFSRGAVKAVGATVQSLYVDQPPADVFVDPTILLLAFLAGMGISLVAALGPVWEAISVSPAEASRRASYELRVVRGAGALAIFGLALLVMAWGAAQAPALNGFPVFGYLSAALIIFGVALMMPVILHNSMTVLKNLVTEIFGSEGKLAVLGLSSTLGRTSVTVASLMLGIAMMISLAIMIGSFRQTVIVWVNQTLKADLYVSPESRVASNRGRLSQAIVEKIAAIPGVADVDAFVELPIEFKGNPTNLGAGDVDVLARRGRLIFVGNEDRDRVFEQLRSGNACVVTESFALRNNVRVGDTIPIVTPQRTLKLQVAGIYYDYASDLGYIIIPRSLFAQVFPDYYSTTVAVYAANSSDTDAIRQAIFLAAGPESRLNIRSNRELRTEVLRIFDNTFSITYALHTIAILVAILGVMNALFALTYEMRREFAILTYVGALSSQIRKIVLIQAGLLGIIGNISGVIVGCVLSLLLINVINKQSFGWTVQLSIPFDFIIESSGLILLFALLSGILPAHVAVRNISPEAVRYE